MASLANLNRLAPKWLRDLLRLLPIRPQFVLSGNIGDLFLLPRQSANGKEMVDASDFHQCLWKTLSTEGFEFLVRYDPVDNISLFPDNEANRSLAKSEFGITLTGEYMAADRSTLLSILRKVVMSTNRRVGVVLDLASRIATSPRQLQQPEHDFFTGCTKLSQLAEPSLMKGKALFNPIIWLVDRPQDLPDWYGLGNALIHFIEVAKPAQDQRERAAELLVAGFAGYDAATDIQKREYARFFAHITDDFTIRNMQEVADLAHALGLQVADIDDAVRSFKTGDLVLDSPWRSEGLKQKIRDAEKETRDRVLGQEAAVEQTLDILKRSVMGLTGAQAAAGYGRPRGVLFFAGPTGVGKTELAKALTRSIFGDENAYIRFDMSEFSAEHADARLLGAPPGYIGYEGGGELTNAIREKPFSVILFDEIEKAHPRLLDKFLQLLEDGRMTDGRGETVYFSESVIVFTSNLGIVGQDSEGRPQLRVRPEDNYEKVKKEVRDGIEQHFKFKLSRPEILNRLGNNIVIFDFIRPPVAKRIFELMIRNIAARVMAEHRATLLLSEPAKKALAEWCLTDLANGGRGIGNRLETALINPLGRALFEQAEIDGRTITVESVAPGPQSFSLQLSVQ